MPSDIDSYCSCSECYERVKTAPCHCSSCDEGSSDSSGIRAAYRGAVTNRYGKYGLITMADQFQRQNEFAKWLSEVHGRDLDGLSSGEQRQLFSQFVEDFNTATFPSKKYYNVLRNDDEGFNDEELRRRELKRAKDEARQQEVDDMVESLRNNDEAVAVMRRKRALRTEMDYLFKTGKVEAAREIQSQLRAETGRTKEPVLDNGADQDVYDE